jgi:glycosyltransferase involved in cell wall biosynthesis
MKILMLFPYAPLPPPFDLAGTKRNLPFLLELARHNEVSVLSYGTPEEETIFSQTYGNLLRDIRFVDNNRSRFVNGASRLWLLATGRSPFRQLHSSLMQNAIDQMTDDNQYDVIHCCVQFFGYFRFPKGIPLSSDTHEVKYDLLRRTAKRVTNPFWKTISFLSYWFGKKEEIELCKRFDLLVTTTERDLKVFRKDLPKQNMIVIQNGAGKSFFEDIGIESEPFTMSFTGLFSHLPNRHGIMHFLRRVFPLVLQEFPDARVYVVGKSPPRELVSRSSDSIIVTGFVEDVRPFVAKSQVFIIPLLAGGGIRGKALEAMAMRRPIVTTSIGVEGIYLRDGHSALFADTEESFAKAIIRLFGDADLREYISRNAYETALREYNWERKGKELDSALRALVARSSCI